MSRVWSICNWDEWYNVNHQQDLQVTNHIFEGDHVQNQPKSIHIQCPMSISPGSNSSNIRCILLPFAVPEANFTGAAAPGARQGVFITGLSLRCFEHTANLQAVIIFLDDDDDDDDDDDHEDEDRDDQLFHSQLSCVEFVPSGCP